MYVLLIAGTGAQEGKNERIRVSRQSCSQTDNTSGTRRWRRGERRSESYSSRTHANAPEYVYLMLY